MEVLPLCGEHASDLAFALAPDVYAAYPPAKWAALSVKYVQRFAATPVQPKWVQELEAAHDRTPASGPSDRTHDPVVYFAVVDGLVKIGTTTNIVDRFAAMNLPPTKRVYVIAGWYETERRYHDRFDAERHPGTEWFTLSDRLRDHLAEMIESGQAKNPNSITPRWELSPVTSRQTGRAVHKREAGRTLVDAAALFVHLERRYAMPTIRARCQSVAVDQSTGRKLYDLDDAEKVLAAVRPRAPHRRGKKSDRVLTR